MCILDMYFGYHRNDETYLFEVKVVTQLFLALLSLCYIVFTTICCNGFLL